MGADVVFAGKYAIRSTASAGEGGDLASTRFSRRDQPTLRRSVDRLDPADHVGWAGARIRISLDGSRMLLGRHCIRITDRVGD